MAREKKGEPKGSPKKYDYTSTKRGQKRTALDNAWAEMVSNGKYKTLRNLMRAIHAKEYALAETQPTPLALDGATVAEFCECGISIESHTGVYCSFRPASKA